MCPLYRLCMYWQYVNKHRVTDIFDMPQYLLIMGVEREGKGLHTVV